MWIIAVHVDDMVLLTPSTEITAQLHHELKRHFEVSNLGPIRQVVGLEVTRDRAAHTLTLRQSQYIDRILQRFGMADANGIHTPADAHIRLQCMPDDTALQANAPDRMLYQAIVGSLMYAAIGTRPDIAYAVQQLSQFAANPTAEHFTAAKRVLWYLKATRDLGIVYQTDTADTMPMVTAYSDADWGNHVDD